MANSYSTQDIVKGALQRVGENTDGSSSYHELALKYANNVYHSILGGNCEFNLDVSDMWTWARTSSTFLLKAFYATGTVTVTNGSTSATFSSAPSISQTGRYLKVDNEQTYYLISAHTASSTSFTLQTAYLGTSGAGQSFQSIPLSYDLGAGILRLVEPLRIYVDRMIELGENFEDEGRIFGLDLNEFRAKWPLRALRNDIPSRFSTYSRSEDHWYILVNKYATSDTLVEFDAIMIQPDLIDSSGSIPLIPREFRILLEYGAAHYLAIDKVDEKKSDYYFKLANAKYTAMHMQEQRMQKNIARSYGQLIPRQESINPYFPKWW